MSVTRKVKRETADGRAESARPGGGGVAQPRVVGGGRTGHF